MEPITDIAKVAKMLGLGEKPTTLLLKEHSRKLAARDMLIFLYISANTQQKYFFLQ